MDRLATGYVRQELRPLKLAHKTEPCFDALKTIHQITTPYFYRGKRLPADRLAPLKRSMESMIKDRYQPFRERSQTNFLAGLDGVKTPFTEYLYWSPRQSSFQQIDVNDEGAEVVRDFDDDLVELRALRSFGDRKRFVLDDLGCNITFSEHLLKRLVERNKKITKPLEFIGNAVESWLPLATLYRVTMIMEGYSVGVALPLDDGLMLGSMSINFIEDREDQLKDRLRIRSDENGITFNPLPVENFFLMANGDKGMVATLRLNTFISFNEMKSHKEWLLKKITNFQAKYAVHLQSLMEFAINPEASATIEATDGMMAAFNAMRDMLNDPFWDTACPIVKNMK
jgi:hypothetical protein